MLMYRPTCQMAGNSGPAKRGLVSIFLQQLRWCHPPPPPLPRVTFLRNN